MVNINDIDRDSELIRYNGDVNNCNLCYCGITIGPIVETLSMASTPAGLWYASYFFSTITREICRLLNETDSIVKIYSPWYIPEEVQYDGIGSYHDRIIFGVKVENEVLFQEKLNNVLYKVKVMKAQQISHCLDISEKSAFNFVDEYLQLHYIIVKEKTICEGEDDKEGILLKISGYLDALELNQSVCCNITDNYMAVLLNGEQEAANKFIKKDEEFIRIVKNVNNMFNLVEGHDGSNIKVQSVNTIAKAGIDSKLKKFNYFAIVQADGDHMGKILNKLTIDEAAGFSKKCLSYTKKSAELVYHYGGVVIYAGGDDLLFLAPLENKQGKIVFELCKDIADEFRKVFSMEYQCANEDEKPGVSFGISLNFHRFPLYESLEDARELLFNRAKNRRNSMAIKLLKSSGQMMGYVCDIDTYSLTAIHNFIKRYNQVDGDDEVMNSIIYQITNLNQCFTEAFKHSSDILQVVLNNIFDHPDQLVKKNFIQEVITLAEIIFKNMEEDKIQNLYEEKDGNKNIIELLVSIFRIAKFFREAGEE